MEIERIYARQILDSRGVPTVEVEAFLTNGRSGRFGVPSGASTGRFEAVELRDNDPSEYGGRGVRRAVEHVNTILGPAICGRDPADQSACDAILLELDNTPDKHRLGANAILGVSGAVAAAAAAGMGLPLFRHLAALYEDKPNPDLTLPLPMVNMISGGLHAGRQIEVQDFLFVPIASRSYTEAMRRVDAVYRALKDVLADRGRPQPLVADEGGLGPALSNNEEALELLTQAIERARLRPGVEGAIAIDVAATHVCRAGRYRFASEAEPFTADRMVEILTDWVARFPIVSLEDGLAEDDWSGWKSLNAALGGRIQILGDDLFVTSPERIRQGIDQGWANAVLIKMNQVGTLTETLEAVRTARSGGFRTVVSARSGETEDAFMADLAVAVGPGQIKVGSITRSERLAKYNQLFRIEEILGDAGIADPF